MSGIPLSSQFSLNAGLPIEVSLVSATLAVRDAIPAIKRFDGMITYQVDTQTMWQLQGGTTNADWVDITGGASGSAWDITGNTGTTPGTGVGENYLGTTDNLDLVIATDATEHIRVKSSNGFIGFNTTFAPAFGVDVGDANSTDGNLNIKNIYHVDGTKFAYTNATNVAVGAAGAIQVVMTGVNNTYLGDNAGSLNPFNTSYNTFLGSRAGRAHDMGDGNTLVGYNAGQGDINADNCVMIGRESGASLNSLAGKNNLIFVGFQSGYNNGDIPEVIAIGHNAAYKNQGTECIFIGHDAGGNTFPGASGDNVIGIGQSAAMSNTASQVIAMGQNAGINNTGNTAVLVGGAAGQNNTGIGVVILGSSGDSNNGNNVNIIGQSAGTNNVGNDAILIGNSAGTSNATAFAVSLGTSAGASSSASTDTIYIGQSAGTNNSGSYVIGLGFQAANSSNGDNVIAIGKNAGRVNNTGGNNILIGQLAGETNGADGAIAIGQQAGQTMSALATNSVVIGFQAGQNNTGIDLVAVGGFSGQNNTGTDVTAIGSAGSANQGNQAVLIGYATGSGNTANDAIIIGSVAGAGNSGINAIILGTSTGSNNTGSNSILMGASAGFNNIGNNVIAIGQNAAQNNTVNGDHLIAIGKDAGTTNDALANIFIGKGSGAVNTTGQNNTFLGDNTGAGNSTDSDNTFIGANAGSAGGGVQVTLVGSQANMAASGLTNATGIGYNVSVAQNNTVILGNGADIGIGTSTPATKVHVQDTVVGGLAILVENLDTGNSNAAFRAKNDLGTQTQFGITGSGATTPDTALWTTAATGGIHITASVGSIELNSAGGGILGNIGGNTYLNLDTATQFYQIGDVSAAGNNCTWTVQDAVSMIRGYINGSAVVNADFGNSIYQIGDIGSQNNGTYFTIDDTTEQFISTTGGWRYAVKNIIDTDSPYAVLTSNYFIGCDTTTGNITVTLPTSPTEGDTYVIKDTTGNASVKNITVDGGIINIDGATTFTINTNYGSITVLYNGISWSII